IIISGVAISLIFVPLTTSTMVTLSQEQIGNASGIFNLMRNVGGSVGIAMITTLVARNAQMNQAILSSHMSPFNPALQKRMAEIQAGLAQQGGTWDAMRKTPAILYGLLQQQAALLSYVHNFRFFAITCLLCAPLVLLFKKVSKPAGPIAAH
ncbi:MAG: EmrB/QacA family drug resistance transporter, partial [Verrucomicrobiota bacterium]|nr:EmrB/QacA family drug resistance transporter [Verrucomicrobiota bacterium]